MSVPERAVSETDVPGKAPVGGRRRLAGAVLMLVGIAGLLIGAAVAGGAVVELASPLALFLVADLQTAVLGSLWLAGSFLLPALPKLAVGGVSMFIGYAVIIQAIDLISGPLRRRRRADAGVEADADLRAFAELTGADGGAGAGATGRRWGRWVAPLIGGVVVVVLVLLASGGVPLSAEGAAPAASVVAIV